MQLDPFGASGPGMQHLVFDLDATRQHSQFSDSGRLFEVNPIVHRYPRLEVCEFNESVPGLATKLFQFRHALVKCPSRPGFQPVKNEGSEEREKKENESSGDRPFQPPRPFFRREMVLLRLHQAKKVPPPTPEGHEGRLFPPEQSFKSEFGISDLTCGRKKILCDRLK